SRDDIGSSATARHTYIESGAVIAVREFGQAQYLPRQFEDGAMSFLRIQSGMGRHSFDAHRVLADSFASSLDRSFQSGRRLQYENRGSAAGKLLGGVPRVCAANLLVGYEKNGDRVLQLAVRPSLQSFHYMQCERDSTFHVQYAGARHASF